MADVEAERECRICRGEDEPGRPLLHPCRCSGSIKYTHEDCLVNWLAQSGSSRCELCNHSFRFEPLYQPNTPSSLPTREFLVGVLALTNKTMRTAARIVLVFTVWLFFLPVGTCWTWYALFINSPGQLPALLASRGPAGIVTDAFYGCLLSAGIVFVFLGVSSLREYVRQFPQDGMGADDDPAFNVFGQDDAIVPDDFEEYSSDDDHHPDPGPPVQPQPPIPQEAMRAYDDAEDEGYDADDDRAGNERYADAGRAQAIPIPGQRIPQEMLAEVDDFVRDTYDVLAGGNDSDADIEEVDDLLAGDSEEDRDEEQLFEDRGGDQDMDANDVMVFNRRESEDEYPAVAGGFAAQEVGEHEPHSEDDSMDGHQHQHQHPHHDGPADNEPFEDGEPDENEGGGEAGALFGLFELDPDEVPLEEVVGLRGHIRNLFDNAGTVLVSNAIFLGVFTLIPLLIGRLTLRLFSLRSFPVKLILRYDESSLLGFFSTVLPSTAEQLGFTVQSMVPNVSITVADNATLAEGAVGKNVGEALKYAEDVLPSRDALTALATSQTASRSTILDEPLVSYVDNFLIVMLGYGVIAFVAVGYIGAISLLRQRYPRLDSPITRQVARLLRYVATFMKIVVLILLEFGIFPLGCGWWLDLCTLEILGGSLQSRLAYCHDSPWTCTGGHWIMGIIYMVHISLFISLLREVLKPQLLWFLRNPDDPEFHPFRELVEKPLSRHARRMCISVIIYVPLILALVYVPGQLCLKFLPTVFPFRSEDFSHILIDVPFGNLLIGPLIRLLYLGRPGVSLHKIVATWIKWVATSLNIEHLVIKDEELDDNNGRRANPDARVNPAVEGLEPADGGPLHRMFADEPDVVAEGFPMTHEMQMAHDEDGAAYDMRTGLSRREIRLRAAVMIFSAWVTLILAESALIAIPTILGRSLMGALGLPVRHDLHPFLLGLNVLFGSVSGFVKIVKYVETMDTFTALSVGLPYLYLAGKGLLIVYIWLGVIPLTAGLLFELVLVPIRVSHNETPYFCLHQDWALGLLLLKVWTCIAVTGGLGSKWRERVRRARDGDIMGFNENFARTMREVVLPVLFSVVTALSVPYSIARGLLPALGAARWVSNLVYRYAYLVITCLYCGFETVRYSVSILRDLHDSIRDDKYLVGKRLYNFIEPLEGAGITSQ